MSARRVVYVDTASLTEDGGWWRLSVLFRREDGAAPTREDVEAAADAVPMAGGVLMADRGPT